jgi:hypothetical protein
MVTTAVSADKKPGGTWTWGPLGITWDLNDQGGVDVEVSVLGIDIDTLSGSINPNGAGLSDTIDILGLVTGTLGLNLIVGQGPAKDGLWLTGQFTAEGYSTGPFNVRIVPF